MAVQPFIHLIKVLADMWDIEVGAAIRQVLPSERHVTTAHQHLANIIVAVIEVPCVDRRLLQAHHEHVVLGHYLPLRRVLTTL